MLEKILFGILAVWLAALTIHAADVRAHNASAPRAPFLATTDWEG